MSAIRFKIVTAALVGAAALGVWVGVGRFSAAGPSGLENRDPAGSPKTAPPAPEKKREPRVDLAKIDRTIAKEPKYQSKTPRYCLLVFGADARTRVWLVHDGDALYVDRNGNGDLTEDGERVAATEGAVTLEGAGGNPANRRKNQADDTLGLNVPFKVGALTEWDGKTNHTLWVAPPKTDDDYYFVGADVDGEYLQMTDPGFLFGDRPKDAPVVHLNGPLAVHPFLEKPFPLVRGEESGLTVRIGTAGVGKYSEVWVNPFRGIPDDVHPTASVEFANKKPGGEPVKVRLSITRRGAGNSLFFTPLSVPDEAADGTAKVTVDFAGWKTVRVAPVTYEVRVETPKEVKKR